MSKVDGSIIGELLLGELPYWEVGVCTITAADDGTITVRGENGHRVTQFEPPMRAAVLGGDGEVYDTKRAAERVNEAIQFEHDEL